MTTKTKWYALSLGLIMLLVGTAVYADINASYSVRKNVVAGGGHQNSTGGTYALSGTAGQTAVGSNSSASYAMNSGFWHSNTSRTIYLPLIVK